MDCDLIADCRLASGARARTLLVRAHGTEEYIGRILRLIFDSLKLKVTGKKGFVD